MIDNIAQLMFSFLDQFDKDDSNIRKVVEIVTSLLEVLWNRKFEDSPPIAAMQALSAHYLYYVVAAISGQRLELPFIKVLLDLSQAELDNIDGLNSLHAMKVHIDVLELNVAVFDLPDLHLGLVIELLALLLVVFCLF